MNLTLIPINYILNFLRHIAVEKGETSINDLFQKMFCHFELSTQILDIFPILGILHQTPKSS